MEVKYGLKGENSVHKLQKFSPEFIMFHKVVHWQGNILSSFYFSCRDRNYCRNSGFL